MAIIETKYYCPDIGMAWKGAVDDFVAYVATTYSAMVCTLTTEFPWIALRVDLTSGSDTVRHTYIVPNISSTHNIPFTCIIQTTGWRYMPPPMPATFAGNSTQAKWRTIMAALRKTILTTWGTSSNDGWTEESGSGSYSLNWAYWHGLFYNREVLAVDVQAIYIYSSPLEFDTLVGLPTDGLAEGQPIAIGGGGGSVDVSGIVEGLQDIATRSVDYVANNGSAIFSMYGKVNTEP